MTPQPTAPSVQARIEQALTPVRYRKDVRLLEGLMTPQRRRLFWARVDKSGLNGCWLWTSTRNNSGYGRYQIVEAGQKSQWQAHRVAWFLERGVIPGWLCIDHLCRIRACVNPAHMELVTERENVLRGIGPTAELARQTVCKHGHPFTPENTKIINGKRECYECMKRIDRDAKRRKKARKREATTV